MEAGRLGGGGDFGLEVLLVIRPDLHCEKKVTDFVDFHCKVF